MNAETDVNIIATVDVDIDATVDAEIDAGNDIILTAVNQLVLDGTGNTKLANLPTSNAGLAAGEAFTQTATQLGGSGTTKVVCVV